MLITLAGQKGGAGKTTIAFCAAVEWMRRGRKVLLVDADPQATALTWAGLATELGHPTPAVVGLGDNLRQALPSMAEAYDVTIIDTPGRQNRRLVGALMLSDVVLLPCQPSPADVWALGTTLDVVTEARDLKPSLRAGLIVNGLMRTAVSSSTKSALQQTGYSVVGELGRRVAFVEAMAAGQGVTAYQPSGAAAREMRNLIDAVEAFASEVANVA